MITLIQGESVILERQILESKVEEKSTTTTKVREDGVDKAVGEILEKYSGIKYSIVTFNLENGENKTYGTTELFTAASTTKVITAVCYLQRVELGKASLDTIVNGRAVNWQLEQMINQSDNAAWYALNESLEYDQLSTCAQDLGLYSYDAIENTIQVSDIALLLVQLAKGQILTPDHRELLLLYMQNTNREDLIPSALSEGSIVYHKYGFLNNNLHDIAIINSGSQNSVLAIFTEGESHEQYQNQINLIREITSAIII